MSRMKSSNLGYPRELGDGIPSMTENKLLVVGQYTFIKLSKGNTAAQQTEKISTI